MKNIYISIILTLLVPLFLQAQTKITEKEFVEHIEFLASDSLKGRLPATHGGTTAAKYIRDEFSAAGLTMLEDDGFQYFDIITGIEIGENNYFSLSEMSPKSGEDFIPLAFSGNGELKAPVSFVGFGLPTDTVTGRKSSYADVDVLGKWVIIIRGTPEAQHGGMMPSGGDLYEKVRLAEKHKAAGVLFVSDTKMSPDDKLIKLEYRRGAKQGDIPVIHITRSIADRIMQISGQYPIDTQARSIRKNQKPMSFDTRVTVSAAAELHYITKKARNVVAMLEGTDPDLKNEYIIIGAHYDHLGMGGWGSGSRVPDTAAAHYGADDNASGTAAVIELAEFFAHKKNRTRRSMIFTAFDAEEMGLLGSAYYAEHAKTDISKTYAMLNFDMVGRLTSDKPEISINGTGTAAEFEDILNDFKEKTQIGQAHNPDGYGASDHSSFYVKDIPVLFFSTGAHEDYHTPADSPDKINYKGMEEVCRYIAGITEYLGNREEALTFKESGSKFDPSKRVSLKATLGIMPGFGATDITGLRIDGVSTDGPAEAAGLKKGDIIKVLDNKPVKDIYEYMDILKDLSPGQTVIVEVDRDGNKLVFPVQL